MRPRKILQYQERIDNEGNASSESRDGTNLLPARVAKPKIKKANLSRKIAKANQDFLQIFTCPLGFTTRAMLFFIRLLSLVLICMVGAGQRHPDSIFPLLFADMLGIIFASELSRLLNTQQLVRKYRNARDDLNSGGFFIRYLSLDGNESKIKVYRIGLFFIGCVHCFIAVTRIVYFYMDLEGEMEFSNSTDRVLSILLCNEKGLCIDECSGQRSVCNVCIELCTQTYLMFACLIVSIGTLQIGVTCLTRARSTRGL